MMAPDDAGSAWRRWRPGIIATVILHGGTLLALSISIHDPHRISAPPSFAVEMVPAPPSAQPQPEVPRPSQSKAVRPDTPLPPIVQPRPAPNGIALPPPAPPVKAPTSAPAAPPAPPAPPPAAAAAIAPAPRAATSSTDPAAMMSWEATVLARLEAAKRYPASARFAHQEATVTVRFDVDRGGHIIHAKLLGPSGIEDLDDESLALLKRVKLPPPPAAIDNTELTLTVPIEFTINRG